MITLRPYRADDEETVTTLWWSSWHSIRPGLRHPRMFPELRARWVSDVVPRQAIVVAEDDGVVVGFAAADVTGRVLDQIFVHPDRKRGGVGRRLLRWAQQTMPEGFHLYTLEENTASRAFYERHGLVAGGTRISPVNSMSTIEYRWTPAGGGDPR